MEPQALSQKYSEDKFLNALADAYRLQEAIISATELCIISTNPTGIITSFNRAAEELLGYKAEEVIGKNTPVIFHDEAEIKDRAAALHAELNLTTDNLFDVFVYKAKITRQADRNEWTYIKRSGEKFPVSLSISVLYDDHQNLIGFVGIALDITEQKHIEQKIKDSEAHLNAILVSLENTILEIDEQDCYANIWSNHPEFNTIDRSKLIGKKITDFFDADFSATLLALRNQVRATGIPQEIEFKSPNENRWFHVKYSPIVDTHQHRSKNISARISEITKRKHAELALRESENKFRLLAENLPGIIYLCRNDARYSMLYLNHNVEQITGYTADDFVQGVISFTELFHPEDKERILSAVDEALKQRTSFHLEYRMSDKAGNWHWVEEHGIGVYQDDALILIEGYLSDITPRKTAEQQLRIVAEENERIFNNSLTLNCVAGYDGYFKKLNPSWEKALGWSAEELMHKPFIEFVHPDDVEPTLKATSTLRDGQLVSTFENRYKHKDGSYRWLLWTSAPDAELQQIYAQAVDITDRKRAEEELIRSKTNVEIAVTELQEQNRQLDEFAHIISHNLRSPVGNIKALIGLLNEQSPIEEYQLIFDKLRNVANNLGETMNELMETLKAKKNKDIEIVPIRFKDMLDKVLQSLEGDLISHEATVTYDFNAAPQVEYSRAYLESILQNLISNAIKYRSTKRKPYIHVTSVMSKNRIQLRVHDNGLGIDLIKFGDKIFGLHKTFHQNKEARGVGLFLTKTQIEAMGGSISIESEVDKGTTFIITF